MESCLIALWRSYIGFRRHDLSTYKSSIDSSPTFPQQPTNFLLKRLLGQGHVCFLLSCSQIQPPSLPHHAYFWDILEPTSHGHIPSK